MPNFNFLMSTLIRILRFARSTNFEENTLKIFILFIIYDSWAQK